MEKYMEYYFTFDNDDIILSSYNEYDDVKKVQWIYCLKATLHSHQTQLDR